MLCCHEREVVSTREMYWACKLASQPPYATTLSRSFLQVHGCQLADTGKPPNSIACQSTGHSKPTRCDYMLHITPRVNTGWHAVLQPRALAPKLANFPA